jgi:hypothetical protein
MQSLNIIIVEKNGTLKPLAVKEFSEDDLYKKCGFKKAEDFVKQTEWNVKTGGVRYFVSVYAKDSGRANGENKYDFPPPIDNKLFFGSCAIVAKSKNGDGQLVSTNLSVELWEKIYEKLFGGFEDLAVTAAEDENEEDELENVPKEKKTKHGYLKDGFVVDSDADNEEEYEGSEDSDDSDDESDAGQSTNEDEEETSDTNTDSNCCNELCEDEYSS